MVLASQNFDSGIVAVATVDDMRERIRRKSKLKGRQADETSLQDVHALIGPRPADGHGRDLLIEQLHQLNVAYRCLHDRHLVALAKEMNIPMAEVYEVAAFITSFGNKYGFCPASIGIVRYLYNSSWLFREMRFTPCLRRLQHLPRPWRKRRVFMVQPACKTAGLGD